MLLEHWRRPDGRDVPLEDLGDHPPATPVAPDDDTLAKCLNRCLDELASDSRNLILEYYVGEGRSRIDRRKRLAGALSVSESALRNRAQRLRGQLERCITGCLATPAVKTAAGRRDTKT